MMGRLAAPASAGEVHVTFTKGLDWVRGDRIAIATNTYDSTGSENNTIEVYDPVTGHAILVSPMRTYHWGAEDSTKGKYGVDIRAEVVLLTRNIHIQGNQTEDNWGCQILTSDRIEVFSR